jgi:hypothetical protein
LEQLGAGDHGSLNDGLNQYQACGAAAREGLQLIEALGSLALFFADFLLVWPVIIGCNNKAALLVCNDPKKGQRVKHIHIIRHFARDHVASG